MNVAGTFTAQVKMCANDLIRLTGRSMFTQCPKCGHQALPADQALPAACPACGVILAKVSATLAEQHAARQAATEERRKKFSACSQPSVTPRSALAELLLPVPAKVERTAFASRVALLLVFALWGCVLMAQDYRTGEMGSAFLHRPLLVFHEAGHVIFRLLGNWLMVLGGTLGQLIMPGILCGALLLKNRDAFGAAIGLWFVGVSVLDVAPYMFDALHPQLMLLSGSTGEEGGHDWIYLFSSMGLLQSAQWLGAVVHKLGALIVLLALGWAGCVLRLERLYLLQHAGEDS
jgi:ribosomal protein S27E